MKNRLLSYGIISLVLGLTSCHTNDSVKFQFDSKKIVSGKKIAIKDIAPQLTTTYIIRSQRMEQINHSTEIFQRTTRCQTRYSSNFQSTENNRLDQLGRETRPFDRSRFNRHTHESPYR